MLAKVAAVSFCHNDTLGRFSFIIRLLFILCQSGFHEARWFILDSSPFPINDHGSLNFILMLEGDPAIIQEKYCIFMGILKMAKKTLDKTTTGELATDAVDKTDLCSKIKKIKQRQRPTLDIAKLIEQNENKRNKSK